MIRRVRFPLLGLGVTLLMCVSFGATAASAAEMILPEFKNGNPETATSTTSKATLVVEGGATIKCEKSSASYSFNAGSNKAGPFKVTFEKCFQGGQECNSLGDAAGTILFSGEWRLVLLIIEAKDRRLMLFSLPAADVHIECPGAAVKLLLVLGEVLGIIDPLKEAMPETKEFEVLLQTVSGVQQVKAYENNKAEPVVAGLEAGEEGGKAKKATFEAKEFLLNFPNRNEMKN